MKIYGWREEILTCPLIMGVGVADVVKAPVLVVKIAAIRVLVPVVPATKIDVGVTPPPHTHRRWPKSPKQDESGRPAK